MTRYLLVAIGILSAALLLAGWLLKSSYEDLAVAKQTNSELDSTITAYQQREKAAEADRRERERVISELMTREQVAKGSAAVANRKLRDALKNNDCADQPVPIVVARVLCAAEGYQSPHCKDIRADPESSPGTDNNPAAGRGSVR